MILYQGKLFDANMQAALLSSLEKDINSTRATKQLNSEIVVNALAALGKEIEQGAFKQDILAAGIDNINEHINTLTEMLKKENLQNKLNTELGSTAKNDKLDIKLMPLGTLFHIAAGNVDGLPAFSVAEGLLTGNINILKLPSADKGLSVKVLLRLIELEPAIAQFVYVFDTPSADTQALQQMAQAADGIVVWGGDEAVSAVRNMAPIGAKLIEWGHKLSFVYISDYENQHVALEGLAKHICKTKQLLCSSCQVILLNTESFEPVKEFCIKFLPVLENEAAKMSLVPIGVKAEKSLREYSEKLQQAITGDSKKQYFSGKSCSLIACDDSRLQLSPMFANCLVKPLPQGKLLETLRSSKGVLQTAGLICKNTEREELIDILAKSGVVRIMSPQNMSKTFNGEAHDGEYALRRYVKIVNIEK